VAWTRLEVPSQNSPNGRIYELGVIVPGIVWFQFSMTDALIDMETPEPKAKRLVPDGR
jgi:hypothetical protein